jgi:hypothetical protein
VADVPRCYCTVVFEADAKPVVDRSNCRVHELDERIRADWDSIDSRHRMITETLTELADRFEKIAVGLAVVRTGNPVTIQRCDAARGAWLAAAGMAREATFDKGAQRSATLDGEVVRREITGG